MDSNGFNVSFQMPKEINVSFPSGDGGYDSTAVHSGTIRKTEALTQEAFDAITEKSPTTLYIIVTEGT